MQEPAGRRERKKQATRTALAAAALRLAAERGPDHVTIDEISEAADVSPRTFFNHFPSKEDAILGTDPARVGELKELLAARPAGESSLEALRATLLGAWATVDDAEAWALRMQLVREHQPLLERYAATFADVERALVEAIADRAGIDPETHLHPWLVVAAALSAMRVATTRWRAAERVTPLVELLDEAFRELAGGFPGPAPSTAGAAAIRTPSPAASA